MIFLARLALGHTSAGSLLGTEEQGRGTEVTAFTLAFNRLTHPYRETTFFVLEQLLFP